MVGIACGEISYGGAEHRRICRCFLLVCLEILWWLARLSLREFLGPKFYIFETVERSPGRLAQGLEQ